MAGESLGSFGGEAAFSGEYDLGNRTDGILFAGPPNFNTLFREFSDNRDPGSPEVQPVYKDGRIVRFTNNPAKGIPPEGKPWTGSRVLYLMHPSDPIVWWSPHLIFSEPDWISEPPGQDMLKGMFWMPFVTFWQVTADLPFATGVPGGHGHTYPAEYVDGWNAVMRPAGMTSRIWPASAKSSGVAGEGLAPRSGLPQVVVDREPRDGEREAVGRDVRHDRGDQAPGPESEPGEHKAGEERHRDRAEHQQHLPAGVAAAPLRHGCPTSCAGWARCARGRTVRR